MSPRFDRTCPSLDDVGSTLANYDKTWEHDSRNWPRQPWTRFGRTRPSLIKRAGRPPGRERRISGERHLGGTGCARSTPRVGLSPQVGPLAAPAPRARSWRLRGGLQGLEDLLLALHLDADHRRAPERVALQIHREEGRAEPLSLDVSYAASVSANY